MDTKQTHTPKQKLDDPTLVWDVPMTSAQARHYWMTSGFVAAELYEVAKRQAKAAPALLAACKALYGTAVVVDVQNKSQFDNPCGFSPELLEQARAAIAQTEKD